MTVKFGSLDFYQAMADLLNDDPHWLAMGTGMTVSIVHQYGPPVDSAFFFAFESGRVVDVRDATEADTETADVVIFAKPENWLAGVRKEINPTSAFVQGKMKLKKGNMTFMLKNNKSFNYILDTLTKIDFE